MSRPILYELFDEIRRDPQWGHPGLEEYYLLFGLLQSKQYPIGSFADIVFVLETLWLKSEQRDKFRKLLEQRMTVLVEWAAYMEKEATKARQAQVVQEIQETKTAGGDQPETMPSNLIGDNDQKGEEKTAEIPGDDKKEM
jgi:succinate dehydrogenase flavin-adding protein (antitoxin of CptAB toxin-antitoxin module)